VKINASSFFRQRELLCLYIYAEMWQRGGGEYMGDGVLNFSQ